jgi:two-component system chemotaxis sensor kinase CheA
MTEDKKQKYLRIFKTEADEHIKHLNEGLLQLEREPGREDLIQLLLRSAHTLKGSARMLGLEEIGTIAHRMEDVFKDVENEKLKVDHRIMDLLFEGADGITRLVDELTSGKKPTVNIEQYEARVKDALEGKPLEGKEKPKPKKDEKPGKKERPAGVEEAPKAKKESKAAPKKKPKREKEEPARIEEPPAPSVDAGLESLKGHIDTIRVVNLTGELILNKTKLETKMYHAKELIENLEDILANWQEYTANGNSEEGRRRIQEVRSGLQKFYQDYSDDILELDYNTQEMQTHALSLRMLPISTLFEEFPRFVRDVSHEMKKNIELRIRGGETELDKRMLEELRGALIHLIRNACDHGIEPPEVRRGEGKPEMGVIDLYAYPRGNGVVIEIRDDGKGMDPQKIRETAVKRGFLDEKTAMEMSDEEMIYQTLRPGFSTSEIITDLSGRGVGLDVVKSNLEDLRGDMWIDTATGKGTTVGLEVPLTLAIINCLLVIVADEVYAIPLHFVEETIRMQVKDLKSERNREVVSHRGQVLMVVRLTELLGATPGSQLRPLQTEEDYFYLVILRFRQQKLAMAVDSILRDQEVIVKSLGNYLKSVQYISGATILQEGEPALILNVFDVFQAAEIETGKGIRHEVEAAERPPKQILVVDDSITSRIVEKNILERAGYEVDAAVDGKEALEMIKHKDYQLFVVDIEMPGIDGFELTRRFRQIEATQETPVVIVTSRSSDQDKRRGIEVGAQAYIVKGTFNQTILLDTVKRLIGE